MSIVTIAFAIIIVAISYAAVMWLLIPMMAGPDYPPRQMRRFRVCVAILAVASLVGSIGLHWK